MSADEISAKIKESRANRQLTIQQLAKAAQVSTQTIIMLEDVEKLKQNAGEAKSSSRKRVAIFRSLTRLAARLQISANQLTDNWLRLCGVESISLSHSIKQGSAQDLYDWYCDNSMPIIRVGLVREGPYASRRDEFYEALAGTLFDKLGCSVEIVREPSFKRLAERLSLSDHSDMLHVLIGLSNTVARRKDRVEFISIPGLQFGLSCLALEKLTKGDTELWNKIKSGPKVAVGRLDPKYKYRLLVMEDEVGQSYLENDCGYRWLQGNEGISFDDAIPIETDKAVKRLLECFNEDKRKEAKTITLLACGEEHAMDVQRALRKNEQCKEFPILNIARSSPYPRFDEAIVVAAHSPKWASLIREALDECFSNSMHRVAGMYAEYFSAVLASEVDTIEQSEDLPSACRWRGNLPRVDGFSDVLWDGIKERLVRSKIRPVIIKKIEAGFWPDRGRDRNGNVKFNR